MKEEKKKEKTTIQVKTHTGYDTYKSIVVPQRMMVKPNEATQPAQNNPKRGISKRDR